MKTAISNIAWPGHLDARIAELMAEFGIEGVEIAPTRVWDQPLAVGREEVLAHRRFWESRGIQVAALQALLFGRPDLSIFGSESVRQDTLDHLEGMMRLGGWLGAKPLVFGSPKNRSRNGMSLEQAGERATAFFREAAARAEPHDVVLCIEPNAEAYGCDFVRTVEEAAALVEAVDHPHFGLHLDAGVMTLNGEDHENVIARYAAGARHFHVSEPFLEPVGLGSTPHDAVATALRRARYPGFVSVEMRAPEGDVVAELARVLALLRDCYRAA